MLKTTKKQTLKDRFFDELLIDEYEKIQSLSRFSSGAIIDDSDINYDVIEEQAEKLAKVVAFLDDYYIDNSYYLKEEYIKDWLKGKIDINRMNSYQLVKYLRIDDIIEDEVL